jgi:hypothetical protein
MEARPLEGAAMGTTGSRPPPSDPDAAADPLLAGPQLWVESGAQRIARDGATMSDLSIGRAPDCDVVLESRFVSRRHARIYFRRTFFVLSDESSNGTWWRSEDGRIAFVHRQAVRLWGSGELFFGEPASLQSLVRFRINDAMRIDDV